MLRNLIFHGVTSSFIVTSTVVVSVVQILKLRPVRRHNSAISNFDGRNQSRKSRGDSDKCRH